MTRRAPAEPAPTHRVLTLTVGIAAAALGTSAWFLLRPDRPLHVVEACWQGYRAARTAADTAAVDRRPVRVTPVVAERGRHDHEPYTCGIWREAGAAGAMPMPPR